MHIVGLTGGRGSGKSTAAAGLVGLPDPWVELSFARPLKQMAQYEFRLKEEAVFGTQQEKDAPLDMIIMEEVTNLGPPWNERVYEPWSGRYLCEYVGQVFRAIDPDHWVKKARTQVEAWAHYGHLEGGGVVISDLRYPNEADMVHDLGGDVIHVAVEDGPTPVSNGHSSDQPLGDEYIDAYAVAPRGDISVLVARVRELAGCRKRDEVERLAHARDAVFEKAIELVRDFRSAHAALEYVGQQAFNNSGATNKTGQFWRLVAEQIRKVCDAPSLQKSANMAKDEDHGLFIIDFPGPMFK